jgi:hypothetical protein
MGERSSVGLTTPPSVVALARVLCPYIQCALFAQAYLIDRKPLTMDEKRSFGLNACHAEARSVGATTFAADRPVSAIRNGI